MFPVVGIEVVASAFVILVVKAFVVIDAVAVAIVLDLKPVVVEVF